MGPAWEDVGRLLTALETDNARDIRDRAMMMLCAIYGLRSSEIIRLTIENIDWEHNQISIWRPKQQHKQIYPLDLAVGNAIIRYLREARPNSVQREIFLTLRAPYRPLSTGVIRHAVGTRFKTLDIRCPRRGPHALRHACATHLVQQGLTLKEVGDHLGHRSSSATRVYAKVDLPALREIAVLPFGGAYERCPFGWLTFDWHARIFLSLKWHHMWWQHYPSVDLPVADHIRYVLYPDQASASWCAFPGFNYAAATFGVGFNPSISADALGKYFGFQLLGSSCSRS